MSQCHTLLIFTKLQRQKSVIKTGKAHRLGNNILIKIYFAVAAWQLILFVPFTAISLENLTFLIANVGPLLTKRF